MIILEPKIKFGKYTLEKFKGEGATAQVWSATNENGKQVAMKIFAPRTSLDNQSRGLLKEEYEKTARLDHPNLLIPYDYIEQNNVPALVMELCDASLWQILKQKATAAKKERSTETLYFTEYELARMLNHLGKALEYLHSKSMVHNDVKPANILVQNSDDVKNCTYYLTDFGITKELRETILRQTKTHSLTYAYASPEKLKGKSGTYRSDIFSLGAAAFELVNGIELEVPLGEILNNNGDIPPLKGGYSNEFESLIQGLLHKDPTQRYSGSDIVDFTTEYLNRSSWPNELRKFDVNRDTALLYDDSAILDKTVRFQGENKTERVVKPQGHISPTERIINIQEEHPKKNKRKISTIILLVMFLCIVGFSGYYLFENRLDETTKISSTSDVFQIYSDVLPVNDTLFIVQKDNKCGLVNFEGKLISKIDYRLCTPEAGNTIIRLVDQNDKETSHYIK